MLSFQITESGKEQLFLNRIKNEKRERGVEIPFDLSQEVGRWLFRQTGPDAYQKEECNPEETGKLGDYTFETIKTFEVDSWKSIALKLMYNAKETKYFLNIQKHTEDRNQHGVEIPIDFVEQIGRYLDAIPKMV